MTFDGVSAGGQPLAYRTDSANHDLLVDLTPLAPGADPVTFTVDYHAPASDSLIAALPRDDDPVPSRVVYTDSEPDRGRRWLVGKHDPSDRASWAVELTVPSGEDVIANGVRARDDDSGGQRVVRYEMDQPIPTYLMAFAAGELEHTDRSTGSVPLALWYRRGLALDPQQNLDAVADAMATYESLVGPYPWDSYSVVLVPLYGGGMENASITFNLEQSGQGNVAFSLNAHELAHQWFGDWVTMRTYDDVWFKEGMATLMAAEAQRARRDGEGRGRLFGTDFSFYPPDAIVDETLTGLAKYTSGPYERAAWTITQIRALVGEEAFWSSLRGLLADNALDSIDGETFVRAFAPALDEATIEKVLAALPVSEVPVIDIQTAPGDGGTGVTLAVSDPGHVLIAPIGITVVDAAGQATTSQLDATAPLTVTVPDGGYLAPDEADVHPYWDYSFSIDYTTFYSQLLPLWAPGTSESLAAFESRSASTQERALAEQVLPDIVPDQLAAVHDQLDSTSARDQLLFDACTALLAGGDDASWIAALAPLIGAPDQPYFNTRYASCGSALPVQALEPELSGLGADSSPAALARLEYLISFDYGAADSFAAISAIALATPSLHLRDLAVSRLSWQTAGKYSPIAAGDRETWKQFFRAGLDATTSSTRFRLVWRGIQGLADSDELPAVGQALHRVPLSASVQVGVVCGAYQMTGGAGPAWQAFQNAAQPWNQLTSDAVAVLVDPTLCNR